MSGWQTRLKRGECIAITVKPRDGELIIRFGRTTTGANVILAPEDTCEINDTPERLEDQQPTTESKR